MMARSGRDRRLELIRRSNDTDLGQALVGLARRAADVHRSDALEAGGVTIAERLALLGEEPASDTTRSFASSVPRPGR